MSEVKAPYDSGAAPAPAATCPTLRRTLEEFASWSNWHVKVEGYGPSVRREYIWDGGNDPTDFAQAALDAPADSLTALERALAKAATEETQAEQHWKEVVYGANIWGHRIEASNALDAAALKRREIAAKVIAARAATGTGT